MAKFEIKLTAVDRATAIINRVNASVGRFTKPLDDVQSRLGKLGKATGFSQMASRIGDIGKTAKETALRLGALEGPMTSLVGVSTIAGIGALASAWGRTGIEIQNAADNIGMGGNKLVGLRRSAEQAGESGNALTAGMTSLGVALEKIDNGVGDKQLIANMRKLGVEIKHAKDGSIDILGTYKEIADVVARQPAQKQIRAAEAFGRSPDELPFLRLGGKGIDAQMAKTKRLGGVPTPQETKAIDDLGKSLADLRTAAGGVGDLIEGRFAPALTKVSDGMTGWIAKNRETAASLIAIEGGIAGVGFAWGKLAWDHRSDLHKGVENIGKDFLTSPSTEYIQQQAAKNGTLPMNDNGVSISIPAAPGGAPSPAAVSSVPTSFAGLPIGLRQNNPLNLRRWPGAPTVGGYAVFGSQEEGLAAGIQNLLHYSDNGTNTLSSIVARWAPPSDGNNDAAYISDVAGRTGLDPNAALDLHNPATMAPLISAMARHETGRDPNKDDVDQAVQDRLGGGGQAGGSPVMVNVTVTNASPGTKVTASRTDGASVPTRVQYAMPSYVAP